MSTTTDHPRARIVALTLGNLADALLLSWSRNYGIPECLSDVTAHDTYTRIVAERQLQEAGVDVFWNDLVCTSATQAAEAVRKVADRGVDLEALYGPNYAALLGLIEGCVLMGSAEIAALGYQLTGRRYDDDYRTVLQFAKAAGVSRLLHIVESDLNVACHKREILSPAALQRHLLGVRAIELTAAYYVLKGASVNMPESFELGLTAPHARLPLPRRAQVVGLLQ